MSETLFTRLASYSQNPAKQSLENFTTEVLVHLINNDKVFKRIFIRHIIRDGRIQRRFKRASAESQQFFGNGIVDIVLFSCDRRILVEVKMAAAETETKIYGKGWEKQVQKYLDFKAGSVAYLTTKAIGAPVLRPGSAKSKRFLGHCYFEDLYDQLLKAKSKLSDCGRLFLEFMEENNMKSLEPFNQQELDKAQNAFRFAKKCENFLNDIRSEVEPVFRKIFHSRTRFTGGHFSPTYESAYIYAKGRLSNNKTVKWIGICIWPANGKLFYGVNVRVLRTGIKNLNRHLKWTEEDGYLFHSHPVRPHGKSGRYFNPTLRDLKKLKRALNQVC